MAKLKILLNFCVLPYIKEYIYAYKRLSVNYY